MNDEISQILSLLCTCNQTLAAFNNTFIQRPPALSIEQHVSKCTRSIISLSAMKQQHNHHHCLAGARTGLLLSNAPLGSAWLTNARSLAISLWYCVVACGERDKQTAVRVTFPQASHSHAFPHKQVTTATNLSHVLL